MIPVPTIEQTEKAAKLLDAWWNEFPDVEPSELMDDRSEVYAALARSVSQALATEAAKEREQMKALLFRHLQAQCSVIEDAEAEAWNAMANYVGLIKKPLSQETP